jgi:radical SAM superfamily enzyme YgiQ (UPF0313 family)
MESGLKMLMVYPDFIEESKHNRNIPGNYSEGIASISAVLKEAGYRVALCHQTWMPTRDEFLARVRSEEPDILGFSLRTTAMPYVEEMAGWLAEAMPALPVICGGYHPTLVPDEVLAVRGIDVVCIGEGEYPLRDGTNRTDIESLYFKLPDGSIVKNPVRPMVEDLDELPFPDLDIFDYAKLRTGLINTAMVMVSRGCLFSCTYCGNSQFRNVYPNRKKYARFRSPGNAIRVIERILERQPNTKYLEFRDAIFNMYADWFYEFMPLYTEKIHLPFNCNLRFDLMDERMVKTLGEGGCYMIDIGLESGDPHMRTKYLHRSMDNEHMLDVTRWLRRYKITTCTYNIVGLPHETLALALSTVKLNARMDVDRVIANIFYPYPMTNLHRIAAEGGFLDATVDPNDKVQLRQPGFSRDEVLYISYRFHRLMLKYRKYFALPPEKAEKKIAALDRRILSPLYPHALIWRLAVIKDAGLRLMKRTAARVLPGVYLMLRNRRIRALTE